MFLSAHVSERPSLREVRFSLKRSIRFTVIASLITFDRSTFAGEVANNLLEGLYRRMFDGIRRA